MWQAELQECLREGLISRAEFAKYSKAVPPSTVDFANDTMAGDVVDRDAIFENTQVCGESTQGQCVQG